MDLMNKQENVMEQETVWNETVEGLLFQEAADEEGEQQFVIDNDTKADWAIRKIAEDKQEYERIKELAEEQIAQLQAKKEAAERRFGYRTGYLRSLLAQYFMQVPHRKTKTQETYQLLSGKLVLKLSKAKPVYSEDELVKYLKESGLKDYVKTEEKAKWGELKKLLDTSSDKAVLKDTGEIIDCIRLEQTPEEFKVEV